jgi:hypothetical protein
VIWESKIRPVSGKSIILHFPEIIEKSSKIYRSSKVVVLKDFLNYKKAYSILSVLGAIPEECGFRTAEISKPQLIDDLCEKHEILKEMNILTDSDAHYLWDISEKYYSLSGCKKNAKSVIERLKQGNI